MRVGHPESRAGLATVQGWNGGREADLLYPTPPHNLGMPTGPETKKTHTHTQVNYRPQEARGGTLEPTSFQ